MLLLLLYILLSVLFSIFLYAFLFLLLLIISVSRDLILWLLYSYFPFHWFRERRRRWLSSAGVSLSRNRNRRNVKLRRIGFVCGSTCYLMLVVKILSMILETSCCAVSDRYYFSFSLRSVDGNLRWEARCCSWRQSYFSQRSQLVHGALLLLERRQLRAEVFAQVPGWDLRRVLRRCFHYTSLII